MNAPHKHQWWADVAVFENVNDGKVLEGFFRDNGLASRIYDDKLLRYFLFLRPPRVTCRVQVRQNDLENAREFFGRAGACHFGKGAALPVLRIVAGELSADDTQIFHTCAGAAPRNHFSRR